MTLEVKSFNMRLDSLPVGSATPHANTCAVCGNTSVLYRAGDKAFCREHREQANIAMKQDSRRLEGATSAFRAATNHRRVGKLPRRDGYTPTFHG